MARKAFLQALGEAQLLVKALKERGETLPVGVTTELREKLESICEKSFNCNVEQEKLKALLKEKTAELDKNITEMENAYNQIKKYIKIGTPKELWREFGIEDKR